MLLPILCSSFAWTNTACLTPGAADGPSTALVTLQRVTPSHQLHRALGTAGRAPAAPYQAGVGNVGVILRHGQVDGQSNTVGKDGEEDDDLEGSKREC